MIPDPTDLVALLVLFLAVKGKLAASAPADEAETKPADGSVQVAVPRAWTRGYDVAAAASALKVVLNVTWEASSRGVEPRIRALVGAGLFVGWVIALLVAWRVGSRAPGGPEAPAPRA